MDFSAGLVVFSLLCVACVALIAIVIFFVCFRRRRQNPGPCHNTQPPRLQRQRKRSNGSLRDSCQRKCPTINYIKYFQSSGPSSSHSVETIYSTPAFRGVKRQLSSDTRECHHIGVKYFKCRQGSAVLCVKITEKRRSDSLTSNMFEELVTAYDIHFKIDNEIRPGVSTSPSASNSVKKGEQNTPEDTRADTAGSMKDTQMALEDAGADTAGPMNDTHMAPVQTQPDNTDKCTELLESRPTSESQKYKTAQTLRAACSLLTMRRDMSYNSLLRLWQEKGFPGDEEWCEDLEEISISPSRSVVMESSF